MTIDYDSHPTALVGSVVSPIQHLELLGIQAEKYRLTIKGPRLTFSNVPFRPDVSNRRGRRAYSFSVVTWLWLGGLSFSPYLAYLSFPMCGHDFWPGSSMVLSKASSLLACG